MCYFSTLQNEYTTCRLIEHDGQWSIVERLVMHNRHKTPNNYLRVHDGGVLGCTASCQNASKFIFCLLSLTSTSSLLTGGGGGSSIVKVPGDVPPARVYFFGLLV